MWRNRFKKTFKGFTTVKIPQITVDQALIDHDISSPIDVVSIDVEGAEYSVLQGFDITKYAPRILLIESIQEVEKVRIQKHLIGLGYILARKIGPNYIYCNKQSDVYKIKNAKHQKTTITPHPIDTGEVVVKNNHAVIKK